MCKCSVASVFASRGRFVAAAHQDQRSERFERLPGQVARFGRRQLLFQLRRHGLPASSRST